MQKRAEDALRAEQSRAQNYLDLAAVMFVAMDADGTVTLINRKGCEILGRDESGIVGTNWFEHFLPEWQRVEVRRVFDQLISGEIDPVEYYENPVLTKSGEERLVAWHNTILRDSRGNITGTLSAGDDITDRRQAEEALQEAFVEIQHLKEQLEAENVLLRHEVESVLGHGDIVGKSAAMKRVLGDVGRVAATDSTVLILGETGVGKELVARAIHSTSKRKDRPLVTVNCAAMPSALLESELFGREKGAYTGALTRQMGRFEMADKSTIFLDEVGEFSPEAQAKLLRVLQDGQFERLGSSKTITVDVRVIAATNRDLDQAVRDSDFREDLYYRLNVFSVTVPPLRERPEDIPLLVWHFVSEFSERMGKTIEGISQRTIERLQQYRWPGNVREVRNAIERAMILSEGPTLRIDVGTGAGKPSAAPMSLDDVQRDHITRVLELADWRVRGEGGAAEILGLKPSTLESRMIKLGISRPKKPR